MRRLQPLGRFGSGCGYLGLVLIAACVLLLVNGVLVHSALIGYRPVAPAEINDLRAQQAIRFIVPLVMLFMEYWLYDWMVDRLSHQGREA